jgi:hypothetical protein
MFSRKKILRENKCETGADARDRPKKIDIFAKI